MGCQTASFLNGHLSEEVYMVQPKGFVNPEYPNHVCKLKCSIYRLKQASRQWNKRFDDEIKKFGFTQNRDESCVYIKASGSNVTFLILYVDDILIMGNHIPMLQDVKSYLGKCFDMKDLGDATYILGIKIYRDRSRWLIGFCQSASTRAEVKRMQRVPYASVNPREIHWTTVKNILKYLRNTKDYVLDLRGWIYISIFMTSYAEAEYIAALDASKEAVWIRKFIFGLGVVPTNDEPIKMYCENTGAIDIAN
ncbi:retrotransposon protein, putative, ty1-copia subclass [Tanacetum coccineum]